MNDSDLQKLTEALVDEVLPQVRIHLTEVMAQVVKGAYDFGRAEFASTVGRALLEAGVELEPDSAARDDIMQMGIENLLLPARMEKSLVRGGISTVGDIVARETNVGLGIQGIKNFGPLGYSQVASKLAQLGVQLPKRRS